MAKLKFVPEAEIPEGPEEFVSENRTCPYCGSSKTKLKTIDLTYSRVSNVLYCLECTNWDYSEAETIEIEVNPPKSI